jgi:ribokinase
MAPSATGVRLIAEAEAAGQTVVAWPGANDFLTVDDLNRRASLFSAADVVSITAEPAGAIVRRALELATQAGKTSVLTYVAGSDLSDAILSSADVLVLSDSTCHGLLDPGMTREQPEHAARVLSQRGAKAVVLLTPDRVLLARGAEAKMVASPQPLDSEDAVDAFVAGLTQGLADGDQLESAIIRAVRAACLLVG